jgi:hypothetical protein
MRWVHRRIQTALQRVYLMSIGTAGAIWSNTMPGNLEKYLPWLTDAERAELYGSITSVTASPRGDPVREGVIQGGRVEDPMKDDTLTLPLP